MLRFKLAIIALFLRINIQSKSEITQKEIDEICLAGHLNITPDYFNMTSAEEYYNYTNIKNSSALEFMLNIFTTGKINKKTNIFIKKSALYIFFFSLAVVTFITWISFLFLWCQNKCIFKPKRIVYKTDGEPSENNMTTEKGKGSEKEEEYEQDNNTLPKPADSDLSNENEEQNETQKETQKDTPKIVKCCKNGEFTATFFLLGFSIAFTALCFGLSFFYYQSISASTCSLLNFSSRALNGYENQYTRPRWIGLNTLKNYFTNVEVLLNDDFNRKYFNYFDQVFYLTYLDQKYTSKIKTLSLDLDDLDIFNEYRKETTILGILNAMYNETLHPIVKYYEQTHAAFNKIYKDMDKIKIALKNYENLLDQISQIYIIIQENVGINYQKFKNIVVYKVTLASQIVLGFTLALTIITVILLGIYSVLIHKKYVKIKYFLHVIWNFLMACIILLFISSGFYGIMLEGTKAMLPTFHFFIGEDYILNNTIQISVFGNITTTALNSFHTCINSKETDLSRTLMSKNNELNYINDAFIAYNLLKNYSDIIGTYRDNLTIFDIEAEKLTPYLNDFSLCSKYIEEQIAQLNTYTDYSIEGSNQADCFLRTSDRWVTNVDNCPSGYTYSKNGANFKNCLLFSDWTTLKAAKRYQAACVTKSGDSVYVISKDYFTGIMKYLANNDKMMQERQNGINELKETYNKLIDTLEKEFEVDKQLFKNFFGDFINFNGIHEENNLFDTFNCSIVRNDLIGFYKNTNTEFRQYSIIEITFIFADALVLHVCIYFLIRSIYKSENTEVTQIIKKDITEDEHIEKERQRISNEERIQFKKERERQREKEREVNEYKEEKEHDLTKPPNPMGMVYDENLLTLNKGKEEENSQNGSEQKPNIKKSKKGFEDNKKPKDVAEGKESVTSKENNINSNKSSSEEDTEKEENEKNNESNSIEQGEIRPAMFNRNKSSKRAEKNGLIY